MINDHIKAWSIDTLAINFERSKDRILPFATNECVASVRLTPSLPINLEQKIKSTEFQTFQWQQQQSFFHERMFDADGMKEFVETFKTFI